MLYAGIGGAIGIEDTIIGFCLSLVLFLEIVGLFLHEVMNGSQVLGGYLVAHLGRVIHNLLIDLTFFDGHVGSVYYLLRED